MIKGKAAYLNRLYSKMKFKTIEVGDNISGASPPSVFVGRVGYPKVFVGPLIPPQHGDTRIMDLPEEWFNATKTVEDIINFRFTLVRGKEALNVNDVQNKTARLFQEVALAKDSLEVEAEFKKRPTGMFFNEDIQPFGPSAPLKYLKITNVKMEPNMEKAYHDTDLKAKDAVIELYQRGIPVSTIQKALSVGAFGIDGNRKFVPTRWGITAVDDTLGLNLLEKIKFYPTIDEYRVYEIEKINNKFVILFFPTNWQYEAMEAWFPQIIGDKLEIYSDFEKFEGKRGYAVIGGCWYAERLSVAEALETEKRQAGIIIFRESYPGYIPLGVWNCRECVRLALKQKYAKFQTLQEALSHISMKLKIPIKMWINQSHLLKELIYQSSLKQFIKTNSVLA